MPIFVGVRLVCDTCKGLFPYDYEAPGKPWREMIREAKIQAHHARWAITDDVLAAEVRCPECKPSSGWIAISFEDRVENMFKQVFRQLDEMATILGNLTND